MEKNLTSELIRLNENQDFLKRLFNVNDVCFRGKPLVIDNISYTQYPETMPSHVGPLIVALETRIRSAMKILTYRQREIVKLHIGLCDGYAYSSEEIANIFKIPREQFNEVVSECYEKMRNFNPEE